MTFLGVAAGWLIGILLHWGADFLPRYTMRAPITRSGLARQPQLALVQLLSVLTTRRELARLPGSMWLNLGVELFAAVLFAWLWSQPFPPINLLLLTLLCCFLILVAIIDLRYRLVLNGLVLPAVALTLLVRYVSPETNMLSILMGGAFGFAIFALAAFVRPGGLGGGDVKLATLIGLIFGFPDALWALLIGILAGGIVALLLLLSHRGNSKSQIPYAPFLSLGALIALFYNPVSLIFSPFLGH